MITSKLKRYLSGLLAALMVLTLLPTSAWATTVASGTCGDNLTWVLDDEGTLTISGTGEMKRFSQWYPGPWCSSYGSAVKKVVIQSGVTSIGKNAFYECSNLTSVTIPSTVTSIGYEAFAFCSSLGSITIGSGVTSIEERAFFACKSLTTVSLSASVADIGGEAFSGCSSLKTFQVASGNPNYSSSSGVLFNKAKTELVIYPGGLTGSYTIPGTVSVIGEKAFYGCTSLTGVTIPGSVTGIGDYAFYGCTGLTSVSIPNSVTSIGTGAFQRCSGLSSITIPGSVSSISNYAFFLCTGLTSVSIPNSVTSIGDYAFCDCSGLTGITIPNSVTSIGNSAFDDCTSLSSISLGSNITSIGDGAFADTAYYNEESNWTDGLLYLGVYLLGAKSGLTSASIRSGTKVIANHVFPYCSGSLTSVTIPNTVVSIGNEAFEYCSGLTSITIPSSVTSIGRYAFYGCTKLSSITIAGKQTSIGARAFDNTAYYNDESNRTDGLLYLGAYLLDADEDITTASIRSGTKVISAYTFSGCKYLSSVTLPSSLLMVDEFAFYECKNLSSVTLPSGLTTIGQWAFAECTGLSSISIPSTVTYIGDGAFRWCTKLSSVTLPKGLDTLHAGTFFVCSALKELTVPEGVTTIEEDVFGVYDSTMGCTSLKKVTLPESLTSVEESAFSGALNLEDVYYVGSQTQWNQISIDKDNEPLTGATIHYNCMATPVAPKVSSSIVTSTGKIKLTWSAVDGAEKYYIYRSTDGGKTYKYYDSTTKTSYTNTSVTPGTKYYYKLKSVSATGEKSAYSNAVYRTADCAKPSLSSSIVTSSGAIKLSWDKVTGAAKYYIYRSTDGGKTYSYYTSTTSTSWTNKSVTPGTKYYYKIKAICSNTEGNSAYSNIVYRTADCAKPSLSSSIVSSSGAIKLSWSKVTGATKYYIYRSTDGGKNYSYYTSTTSTSWTNKNVTPGKTYYYKIKAICSNTEGNSAYSNVVSRTADCAKPVVTIQLNGGKPQLKWSAIDGAKEYVIYRATSKSGTYTKMLTTTKLSYTNTGAKSGTTYYYKVMAICAKSSYGNSAYSNIVSIKSK